MDILKSIFNKNTSHGRAIRTGLQVVFGLVTFLSGLLLLPGLGDALTSNNIVTVASFGVWVGVISYIQNSLEQFIKWMDY